MNGNAKLEINTNQNILLKGSRSMLTTSESAVTITIWVLTAAGTFFGTRTAWRRRVQKHAEKRKIDPLQTP